MSDRSDPPSVHPPTSSPGATTLWINPFNGISGDMFLGALIDVGADVDAIRSGLSSLDVSGWTLTAERVERHGMAATNAVVTTTEETAGHRRAADIIALVERSRLPRRVIERATQVFAVLAVAEGEVHGKDPGDVHFHEVGGVDAIVDVVGCCLALESLDVDQVAVGTVAVGHGTSRSTHGQIPNPAPATVRLLTNIPSAGIDTPIELTTPTGAALIAALATPGPMPAMTIRATGFGAGDAEPADLPNLLQLIVGRRVAGNGLPTTELVVIESNVDDATGETLAHTIERLLETGARDAWITAVTMKKGRPAHVVSALVESTSVDAVGATLLAETGSIGYRAHRVERFAAERWIDTVTVGGHEIAIKVTEHRSKAEHVDVVAAARALGRPARDVAAEAEARWRAQR